MLDIDRLSLHDREVPARFGGRERRLGRDGWIALGVAAGFHLLGILLFEVTEVSEPEYTAPVTLIVESVSPYSDMDDLPDLMPGGAGLHAVDAQLMNGGAPQLAHHVQLHAEPGGRRSRSDRHYRRYFDATRESSYVPEKIDFSLTQTLHPIVVQVSGPLARLPVRTEALDWTTAHFHGHTTADSVRLVYAVQVDLEEGRIFWNELTSHPFPTLEPLAQRLLTQLEFETSSTGFVLDGEVALILHLDDSPAVQALVASLPGEEGTQEIADLGQAVED